jgi:hypothetical protein
MNTHADKKHESKNQSVANEGSQKKDDEASTFQFSDNRSKATAQEKLQEMASNSPQAKQLSAFQKMADNYCAQQQYSIQRKQNKTGLPDNLKSGIENLSGYSMDDVKVHYNSDKPAQLQAHAYAQGKDIHIGSGQEKNLPHEAWHVVQQKQGRVKPTLQMKAGVPVNDDANLEREADVMGAKALQGKWHGTDSGPLPSREGSAVVQRRKVGKFGVEAEVADGSFQILAPKDTEGGNLIQDEAVSFEERKLADLDGHVSVTLDGEMSGEHGSRYFRKYTVEYIQRPVDVELESEAGLDGVATAWEHALTFWQAHIGNNQALKTELGDWYSLQRTWHGEQFEDREDTPGVTDEEEAQFDWTNEAYFTGIVTEAADPGVSMQMTAGSTLLGLMEVYFETVAILSGGAIAEGENREAVDSLRHNSEARPETTKLQNFTYLISKYIEGNGNTRDERERSYAKEYVTLMSRTSLDLVYQQLNAPAKGVFETQVAAYLFNKEPNPLSGAFKRPANERVFVKDAKKEDVTEITIEQLLLSIIKKKRAEVGEALVVDEAAEEGDVLVQNNLVGLGEINQNAPDMVAKFGLDNPGEMMHGIPGMIFENRAAMPHNLSAMPGLFRMLAASLHRVNVAHEQALLLQEQARARAQQPAQAAASDKKCYLTTACVTQRGLPDDCEELQLLRAFRDEVIAPLPVGPDLIKCYYSQAPGIVEAIDGHAERHAIYDQIYEIIGFCVDAIKGGHEAVALAAYCEMVIGLERAFQSGERFS